jgi:UDP-N-acetylglucosamine diphosphorylase / glucose-1-phosphate thymidylyltransferase / UDP-N-acetylgalactosamine diphosphorylase / glucosamine-1-phosphate N-acetyltransferase / galactosamine-1-phosphate N-acetyltransferase
MELIFRRSKHFLHSIVDTNENESQTPVSSLKVLHQPLIVRNVSIANRIQNIHRIKVPSKCSTTLKLLQDNFSTIDVDEYEDVDEGDEGDDVIKSNDNNSSNTIDDNNSTAARSHNISIKENMDYLEIPLNSAIWYLQSEKEKKILINPIKYPWDLHYVIQKVLQDEVTHVSISPNASISKTTVFDGPCIIEDDVTIDDFCKIKGPTYISKGSFIGMSSLIRNCMLGNKTRIGFNCEVARSYLLGGDKISHQNIILDSIIGENVWFGAYAATLNALSTKQKISYEIEKGKSIDTGIDRFGALVGNNCTISTSVIIMPGRHIQADTMIQALWKTYEVSSKG